MSSRSNGPSPCCGCLAGGPAGVSQIAERVGLPKSTVSRLLSTLQTLGAVEQVSAGGAYRVGEAIVELASAASPGRSLADIARPHVQDLVATPSAKQPASRCSTVIESFIPDNELNHAVQIRDWTGERLPPRRLLRPRTAPRVSDDDRGLLAQAARTVHAGTMIDPSKLRKRLAAIRSARWSGCSRSSPKASTR